MGSIPTYRSKWPVYARQWDAMKITRPGPVRAAAKRILGYKDRYLEVEKDTGVPWWLVGVLHLRESNLNFRTQLAQGDPLNRRSTRVPRGRGPFSTWREGAYDALVTLKGLNRVQDWRLEKAIYHAERYNGLGYHWRGLASPYIWAGSTVQQAGKFVADGKFSATVWDQQLGCAAVIKDLASLDPGIKLVRET
jgi:lysozyme family protein